MNDKTTLVLGASPKSSRYSNIASKRLINHGEKVILVGLRAGEIEGNKIYPIKKRYIFEGIHTITVYMNPSNQSEYESYMLELNPKRIIFNPGTENMKFAEIAKQNNIEIVFDCTLVMLGGGYF